VKLHRSAQRRKTGEFLAEGANAVEAALDARHALRLFHTAELGHREAGLVGRAHAAGIEVYPVSAKSARQLGDTITPPGLVAVCRQVDVPLDTVLHALPTMLAIPVGVAEPGNAGTLIRVADAVGVDAVIFLGDTVDPHNGKCVRATAGSLFHVPIVRTHDVAATLDVLSALGIRLLAAAADGEVDLDHAEELLAGPVAWLFGNEAHGLDPAVAARADHRVRIRIHGRAESLNLAAAAAICLYTNARVRHGSSG
jgi:TrmH family RNA methyltransferase